MIVKEVQGRKGISEFVKVAYNIYQSDDKKVFSIELILEKITVR